MFPCLALIKHMIGFWEEGESLCHTDSISGVMDFTQNGFLSPVSVLIRSLAKQINHVIDDV